MKTPILPLAPINVAFDPFQVRHLVVVGGRKEKMVKPLSFRSPPKRCVLSVRTQFRHLHGGGGGGGGLVGPVTCEIPRGHHARMSCSFSLLRCDLG